MTGIDPVLVGVSDSAAGKAAIRLAMREAASRACGVHLVRVWRDVCWLPSMTRADAARMPEWERSDKRILAIATAVARRSEPAVEVTAEWLPGDLYAIMQAAARRARLVVVGASGPGDSRSDLGAWLQHNVRTPVVVVDAAGRTVGSRRSHASSV